MFIRMAGIAALLVASVLLAQATGPRAPSALPDVVRPVPIAPAAPTDGTGSAITPIPEGFRVRVPRLRIDLPIVEGVIERDVDRQRTPEGSAFHLPGSAIPGERGNTYLYSHARAGMFLALWDARVGDEVMIDTPDGRRLVYVVSAVRARVAPTDTSVAQPTSDERITLQTSTGPDPSDPRFVVIALPRP